MLTTFGVRLLSDKTKSGTRLVFVKAHSESQARKKCGGVVHSSFDASPETNNLLEPAHKRIIHQ